ncbi:hypothetical protein BB560_002920 [Smittium megazygosporum]|uniref:DNA helicase n=1 Tax=Smittium megazygosporum TaxID=133381 RepID=A0A2T9ZDE8_9FUNG|nr:hypothetical protein BB560_002920 [Smittium megazygosporum]
MFTNPLEPMPGGYGVPRGTEGGRDKMDQIDLDFDLDFEIDQELLELVENAEKHTPSNYEINNNSNSTPTFILNKLSNHNQYNSTTKTNFSKNISSELKHSPAPQPFVRKSKQHTLFDSFQRKPNVPLPFKNPSTPSDIRSANHHKNSNFINLENDSTYKNKLPDSISISSELSDSVVEEINWEKIDNKIKSFVGSKDSFDDQTKIADSNVLIPVDYKFNSFESDPNALPSQLKDEIPTKASSSKEFGEIPIVPEKNATNESHSYDKDALLSYLYPTSEEQKTRAYQQFAISKCLRQNTLVSLPTGLGKTFIAAVVMGNFARWFPEGICIFLAPSRPLVTQQAKACAPILWTTISQHNPNPEQIHSEKMQSQMILENVNLTPEGYKFKLNGKEIVSKVICEMNGLMKPALRKVAWCTSKFIFATPQTVQNDLKTGVLSQEIVNKITLLVIDEAHRTKGGYAFGNCMDELINIQARKNLQSNQNQPQPQPQHFTSTYFQAEVFRGNFRVLALTATPGTDVKSVQMIVDRLHLSDGFFRTEQSLDVSPFVYGKKIVENIVCLPAWHNQLTDSMANIAKKYLSILCNEYSVISMPSNIRSTVPYYIMMNTQRWSSFNSSNPSKKKLVSAVWEISMLLIRLLQMLQLLQTQGFLLCYNVLNQIVAEANALSKSGNTSITSKKLDCVNSREFSLLLQTCSIIEKRINANNPEEGNKDSLQIGTVKIPPGRIFSHPKLQSIVDIILDHFKNHGDQTRIIVFTQYRGSVDEIVSTLKKYEPQIKPSGFVGQGRNTNESDYGLTDYPNSGSNYSGNMIGSGLNSGGLNTHPADLNRFSRGRGNGRRGGNNFSRSRGSFNGFRSNRSISTNSSLSEVPPLSIPNIENTSTGISGNQDDTSVGKRGQNQKEQQKVIESFKNGAFNVLVATCVAEEGLDICEVDLVIHYDAPKSPIQLLQRTGRTGRSRKGGAVVLLTQGTTEQQMYTTAIRKYNNVQNQISKPGVLHWHKDLSPSMLPDYFPNTNGRYSIAIKNGWPKCVYMDIDKQSYEISRKLASMDLLSKSEITKLISEEKASNKAKEKQVKELEKAEKKRVKESKPKGKRAKLSTKTSFKNLTVDKASNEFENDSDSSFEKILFEPGINSKHKNFEKNDSTSDRPKTIFEKAQKKSSIYDKNGEDSSLNLGLLSRAASKQNQNLMSSMNNLLRGRKRTLEFVKKMADKQSPFDTSNSLSTSDRKQKASSNNSDISSNGQKRFNFSFEERDLEVIEISKKENLDLLLSRAELENKFTLFQDEQLSIFKQEIRNPRVFSNIGSVLKLVDSGTSSEDENKLCLNKNLTSNAISPASFGNLITSSPLVNTRNNPPLGLPKNEDTSIINQSFTDSIDLDSIDFSEFDDILEENIPFLPKSKINNNATVGNNQLIENPVPLQRQSSVHIKTKDTFDQNISKNLDNLMNKSSDIFNCSQMSILNSTTIHRTNLQLSPSVNKHQNSNLFTESLQGFEQANRLSSEINLGIPRSDRRLSNGIQNELSLKDNDNKNLKQKTKINDAKKAKSPVDQNSGGAVKLKEKQKPKKKSKSSIHKYFDFEASLNNDYDDDEDYVVYSSLPAGEKTKGIIKRYNDEDSDDLDCDLDDGFIVSDGHLTFESSQNEIREPNGLITPVKKIKNQSNASINEFLIPSSTEKIRQRESKQYNKHRNRVIEDDSYSFYRQVHNNLGTQASQIRRQAEIWEDNYKTKNHRNVKEQSENNNSVPGDELKLSVVGLNSLNNWPLKHTPKEAELGHLSSDYIPTSQYSDFSSSQGLNSSQVCLTPDEFDVLLDHEFNKGSNVVTNGETGEQSPTRFASNKRARLRRGTRNG